MKIAVLGSKGFIGSNVVRHLSQRHQVFELTRDRIDLLNYNQVSDFLEKESPDVVINAAAQMTDPKELSDTRNNLGMFLNFYTLSYLFGKFINIGSGAEFDRARSIDSAKPREIFDRYPEDSYGFGQNTKSRLSWTRERFYNLRIFNCFGSGEIPTRIFPKFLNNYPISIDDRYFDYFSIQDFLTVIDTYVEDNPSIKDVNCVYSSKYKISEVMEQFKAITKKDTTIKIVSHNPLNYTGSSAELDQLNLPLQGLEKGLQSYVRT